MENLQTEVLELEFNEFAKGMPTITEEEFAYILLRYTILSKDDHREYIDRLKQRIPHSKVWLFYLFWLVVHDADLIRPGSGSAGNEFKFKFAFIIFREYHSKTLRNLECS